MEQAELFSAANLARTFDIPAPPALAPHEWPFPGLSPEDSARATLARSALYTDLLIALVKQHGGTLTYDQLLALVPEAWRALLGLWAHAFLSQHQVEGHGIDVRHVRHAGARGFHWEYHVVAGRAA